MAQGDFTKEETVEASSALRRIFKGLSLRAQQDLVEEYDRVSTLIRLAKEVAPSEKPERSPFA